MSLPKLYFNIICPPCRAVYMLARMLEIKLEYEEVDIMSRNYMKKISKINSRHTIPILYDNGYTLTDSHVISTYLVQKFTTNTTLYPSELQKRATVDQYLHYDSGVLYPILYQAITPILFRNQFGLTVSNVSRIQENYGYLNTLLAGHRWLASDDLTLADMSCLGTMSTLDMLYPVDAKHYSNLHSFLQRCEKLPYYGECHLRGLSKLAQVIQEKIIRFNTRNQTASANATSTTPAASTNVVQSTPPPSASPRPPAPSGANAPQPQQANNQTNLPNPSIPSKPTDPNRS